MRRFSLADVAFLATSASTIGTIPGLVLWLKADAITGKNDGDAISSWPDSSGNSNDAVQATGAKQGIYKTAIQNSLPVVRFDVIDDGMTTPLSLGLPLTVFVVYSHRGAVAVPGRRAVQGHTNNWLMGPYNGTHAFFNGTFMANGLPVVQNMFVVDSVRQTAAPLGEHWTNRILRDSTGSSGTPAAFSLAASGAGANFPEPLDGDIAEILVYNVALSNTNRNTIWDYLHGKYAIA